MSLWLARHAQPLIASGVCYGATDVSADAAATRVAAKALAQVLPQSILLRSSTLQRCVQLTQTLLALRPDLTCTFDARLTEMNFGCWEGQRWDAIAQTEMARWTADFAQHACGGAESVAGFMQRVAAVWDEQTEGGQDAVWITHAGVIRAAGLLAKGLREIHRADQWPQDAPAFGQWCCLEAPAQA
jgi:alpha-ribazole phosphatase